MLSLLFAAALVTVTQCRVKFTLSEVLQQSDLDGTMTASFKCDNGCFIYSDSRSPDMCVSDGTKDVTNFSLMGPPDRSLPIELPGKDYKLVYRGKERPTPPFVFYVVDKKSPNVDTPVYMADNEAGFLSVSSLVRKFTLLNSHDPPPYVTFQGDFAASYPRIYATGYDAATEDACKPVYQARSQESALNSWITVPSPILTVDNGPKALQKNVVHRTSGKAIGEQAANSSVVYMSPGYVGCSYTNGQIYSTSTNTVLDNFSANVKSLDFAASINIPSANEAVHITVNNEKVDLYGVPSMSKHYDADQFYVTISWIRNTATSSFAVQFDLGVESKGDEEEKSTTKGVLTSTSINDLSTTSESVSRLLTLSPLLTVAYITLRR